MTVCTYCDNEMSGKGSSCVIGNAGRIRYVPCIGCAPMIERESKAVPGHMMRYPEHARNCPDCNTPPGGFHHPGCDDERCPRGHVTMDGYLEQAISCGQCEEANTEIETCIDWQGPGLALHELGGGTRHRWHCLDCDEKGPAEVDGAVCKYQLGQHISARHTT